MSNESITTLVRWIAMARRFALRYSHMYDFNVNRIDLWPDGIVGEPIALEVPAKHFHPLRMLETIAKEIAPVALPKVDTTRLEDALNYAVRTTSILWLRIEDGAIKVNNITIEDPKDPQKRIDAIAHAIFGEGDMPTIKKNLTRMLEEIQAAMQVLKEEVERIGGNG